MRVPFACVFLAEVGAVALVAQHDRGAVVVGGGDGAERVAERGEALLVAVALVGGVDVLVAEELVLGGRGASVVGGGPEWGGEDGEVEA